MIRGGAEPVARRLWMRAARSKPGWAKSRMTHWGVCCWISVFSTSRERAGLTLRARSRAVAVMRLVKSMSSERTRPRRGGNEDGADMERFLLSCSNGFGATLPGADADAVLERQDEDLPVADAPFGSGTARLHDRVHGRFDEILVDGDLQLDFPQQIYRQLVAA